MQHHNLESIFKRSGIPDVTYVKPKEYNRLLIALRTPGKGVVVEGPSKIGKTSSVMRILNEIDKELPGQVTTLTARDPADRDFIATLPSQSDLGIVIIDDFHRLDLDIRESISDFMKILADQERLDSKIVVVGINKVGQSLLALAPDLAGRIDVIKLGVNSEQKIGELISKGCAALNIEMSEETKRQVSEVSAGSFNIAQMICFEMCLLEEVMGTEPQPKKIATSFTTIRETVIDHLSINFLKKAEVFASGKRRRKEGRAPYLQILRWLSMSDEWTIDLDREVANNPKLKASVGQVVKKRHLEDHLAIRDKELGDLVHYDPETRILAVEDPQFFFFIRHMSWNKFSERLGYYDVTFSSSYDFALSFAGTDRPIAEALLDALVDREISVFYDFEEQSQIIGCDVETYLAPIYGSESTFIIPIMGTDYPNRLWTKFESDIFRNRFGEKSVFPIWLSSAQTGIFDTSRSYGGFSINESLDLDPQIQTISDALAERLGQFRLDLIRGANEGTSSEDTVVTADA